MRKSTQLLGAVSAVALIAMSSAPALAEGIRAGTVVTNTATVDYQVGGQNQTQIEAEDQFSIDRRINVTVTAVDTPKGVNPGENNAFLTYDVTNLSNDTVDLDLSATLAAGTAGNYTNIRIFVESGAVTSGFDINADTEITSASFLDEVLADETVRVYVVADIGNGAVNGNSFSVDLNANAHEANTVGTLGDEYVESAGDSVDQSVIDTVLADGNTGLSDDAGVADASDGSFTARGVLNVEGAELEAFKSSVVVSDPVNNNPTGPFNIDPAAKAIPGAVIRYCIAVRNGSGASTAENVAISDILPGEVTFNTGTIRRNVGVTITGATGNEIASCDPTSGAPADDNPGNADGGGFTSNTNTVAGTINDVIGGSSAGFMFEVTIAPVDGTDTDTVTANLDTDNPN